MILGLFLPHLVSNKYVAPDSLCIPTEQVDPRGNTSDLLKYVCFAQFEFYWRHRLL